MSASLHLPPEGSRRRPRTRLALLPVAAVAMAAVLVPLDPRVAPAEAAAAVRHGASTAATASTASTASTADTVRAGLRAAGDRLADPVGVVGAGGGATVEVTASAAVLDAGGDSTMRVGLPRGSTSEATAPVDGRAVFADTDAGVATVVSPTSEGVQVALVLEGRDAPTAFDFDLGVPAGATLRPGEGGGVDVIAADRTSVASIAAPWAIDATGSPVPTRFEIHGSTVRQVVDHRLDGVVYPVTADPEVKRCDVLGVNICVKFSRSETRVIANYVTPGVIGAAAWASYLCSKISGGPGRVACTGYVAVYAYLLNRSFNSAAGAGRCVQIHFTPVTQYSFWKTVDC